ncbi:MAG: UTP--glucose-phosphate uridylyltransferase, partial [Myxococcaceae bacterium]|nr:UTP--glucose-phosphate uridylyltransferase [Myxococcaceae bacterium]
MSTLDDQLDKPMRELLARYRFDAATFERLRLRLQSGQAEPADNRVREPLGVPEPDDIIRLPAYGSAARAGLRALGLAALGRGEVAACILAGGMATRFGGVVKAGVEVVSGHSFLELKLRDVEQLAEQLQRPVSAVLMTSFATDAEIQRMVSSRQDSAVQVTCFAQSISLRLSADGQLFRDQAGRPSPYAPGHGDMTFALAEAGLLARLQRQGVRYLYVSNVDNLAASLDPSVIGAHLEGEARMTFEVAPLWPGDQGGVPARLAGRLQVIEALRYPA